MSVEEIMRRNKERRWKIQYVVAVGEKKAYFLSGKHKENEQMWTNLIATTKTDSMNLIFEEEFDSIEVCENIEKWRIKETY